MGKITYLLGAGASAHSIPLVKEIPQRLNFFYEYIISLNDPRLNSIAQNTKALAAELDDFNTIDTYARNLTQNETYENQQKLKSLKSLLTIFFLFEQHKKKNINTLSKRSVAQDAVKKINTTLDPRYKSLFGKILIGKKINEEINIISWNYDLQLEIGLENNIGLSYDKVTDEISIFPHPSYKEPDNIFSLLDKTPPSIVKLNGTAGLFDTENKLITTYENQSEYFEDIIDVCLNIHKNSSRFNLYNPLIKFAWEKDSVTEQAMNMANRIIQGTKTLIVIGYSFPDYNRPIDNVIFNRSSLSEIIIQAPAEDYDTIRKNMSASIRQPPSSIEMYKNLQEFYLPPSFIPKY